MTADDSSIINRISLSDAIYDCLSDEIMHGKIADGSELSQVELAARFGVSRIPVREALRRLQAESLVIATPYHPFVVRKVTPEQVLELVDVRAALEDLALSKRGLLDAELIKALRDLNQQMAQGGEGDFLARDREFHSLILGPDTMTVEILQDVRRKVHKYLSVMVAGKTRRTTATKEHTKIIDALEARDMSQARILVHEHVMRSRDFVAQRLARENPLSMARIRAAIFRHHLPGVVATATGAFDAHEVSPSWTIVRSSGHQRSLVESATADLAHTTVDNVAVWHSPSAPWAVTAVVDLGIPHQIVVREPRGSLEELCGARVAVDSARSGFVTLLRSVLPGPADFVEVGALQARLEALRDGSADACLLGAEQLNAALAEGFSVMGALNDYFPGFPGLTITGLPSGIPGVSGYVDALRDCAAWCFDPTRRDEVISLAGPVLGLSPHAAAIWYQAEVARCSGIVRAGIPELRVLERAWRATGRIASDQSVPEAWFRPGLLAPA